MNGICFGEPRPDLTPWRPPPQSASSTAMTPLSGMATVAAMTIFAISPKFPWYCSTAHLTIYPGLMIELGAGISIVVIAAALEKNESGRSLTF